MLLREVELGNIISNSTPKRKFFGHLVVPKCCSSIPAVPTCRCLAGVGPVAERCNCDGTETAADTMQATLAPLVAVALRPANALHVT
jgi:hypothetical protein